VQQPPNDAAIELRGLTKRFGDTLALDHVDLVVRPGVVFGFLGRNGAGKTTALRILSGLARPTSGAAHILGHDVTHATDVVRSRIGFLPDVPGFYPWMTAREYLDLAGRLFGLDAATIDTRATTLLEMAGLASVKTRIGGYSRGMKQRLGIAQALINAPSLLMLDEPTSALDPALRSEMRELLRRVARGELAGASGTPLTLLMVTHETELARELCSEIWTLADGRLVERGM